MEKGLSGRIAQAFLQSKLTILLMVAFLLMGAYSTFLMPREEEPQIQVPMADVFLAFPGGTPRDVETKVVAPLEKIISNIKGVEYVYSTSMKGQAMLIVQFFVGEDVEHSLVKLYSEVMKNMDQFPAGVSLPLIKSRAIDDVPVVGLTLWGKGQDDHQLRLLGEEVANEIKKIPDVSTIQILGGRSTEVAVVLDPLKMSAKGIDFTQIYQAIGAANAELSAGAVHRNDTVYTLSTGSFLQSPEEVEQLVVGVQAGQPIYLHQVAKVQEQAAGAQQYVGFGYGAASGAEQKKSRGVFPAITLSIAKKQGADAMQLAENVQSRIETLKKKLIPSGVEVTVSRNYGESASHKVSELLLHLFIAIVVVTLFVMLAMGWRGGLVVFLSVPVTFALTLFSYYMLDYTLNRITLFALVFITGIVVDDSIIIAENMHRHFKMKKLPPLQAALYAINEVGNPTILATFTVIAAVLPMAFVTGLMGPYMSPMPIGASIAMMLSLVVALTLTPYLGYLFLREKEKKNPGITEEQSPLEKTPIYKLYASLIQPLLATRWKRWTFILGTVVVLLGSLVLFYTKTVAVKMLPFDNKNEFQVVLDLPEGSSLERTQAVAQEISAYLATQQLVRHYQTYVGTAGPISFNGLVRHYDLRRGAAVADIQVNLTDKSERKEQSHDIARKMRPAIQAIANRYGANAKLVEVPPGPPVLSTLVAEVYGPEYGGQIKLAKQIKDLFQQTKDVVDVDWMVEDDQQGYRLVADKEKAMRYGISGAQINAVVAGATAGWTAGNLQTPNTYAPVPIQLQLNDAGKSGIEKILALPLKSATGSMVPLGDLVHVETMVEPKSIFRKNQKEVVYVMADMAGELESPFYAISSMSDSIKQFKSTGGLAIAESYTQQPPTTEAYTIKWDGEWQITFEVFRDLGIAFAAVLLIIYMLIVGWFQNFTVPLIMLAAIPLSLVGIVLGHWMMGAYFTATSMIGFIALAGVMVRNSILLIDFINIRLEEGIPLHQATIEAGAVRTTPILLTAGAVVLGAVIILFDPIFQGLAISLMGGTITSTFLTLLVVPLLYEKMLRNKKTLEHFI